MATKNRPLPKTLGACADEIGAIDARLKEIDVELRRLKVSKEAIELAERRKLLEKKLIDELPASDADGICGKTTRATIKAKRVPVVKDWNVLCKYVKKTGAFELFHRQVTVEAVRERWDAKKEVPGVEGFTVKKLSITKK